MVPSSREPKTGGGLGSSTRGWGPSKLVFVLFSDLWWQVLRMPSGFDSEGCYGHVWHPRGFELDGFDFGHPHVIPLQMLRLSKRAWPA